MPRDRGIEYIKRHFWDFLDLIEKRIKAKGKVKILDAGCGHGVGMIDLVKRFGEDIEIVGFNYSPDHGNPNLMRMQAIKKGIFTREEFRRIKNKPKFMYFDASKKLPFVSNSFDFIYSMSAIYLFEDKVHFFEECNRILRKDGIARLSIACKVREAEQAEEYTYPWEIWDKGKLIAPRDYFSRFDGIRIGPSTVKDILEMEIRKRLKMDCGLKLITSIDSNFIWHKWMGVKSIYTTQRSFKPYWK